MDTKLPTEKSEFSKLIMNRNNILRCGIAFSLTLIILLHSSAMPTHASSYSMKYGLAYTGVPFAGGAIVLASNITNNGQLTIKIRGLSFASDFWSNGTRQASTGLPLNLTMGASKVIDTPVLIPAGASLGNHVVTGTVSWQFYNASGWFNASPIVTSTTVPVSQTIGSLFASYATVLTIGLVVAAAIIILVVLVTMLRKKSRPEAPPQMVPRSGP